LAVAGLVAVDGFLTADLFGRDVGFGCGLDVGFDVGFFWIFGFGARVTPA